MDVFMFFVTEKKTTGHLAFSVRPLLTHTCFGEGLLLRSQGPRMGLVGPIGFKVKPGPWPLMAMVSDGHTAPGTDAS